MGDMIPKKNHKIADETLDESEIVTRILYVLHQFHIYDLEKFDWSVRIILLIFLFRGSSKTRE